MSNCELGGCDEMKGYRVGEGFLRAPLPCDELCFTVKKRREREQREAKERAEAARKTS